jgi:hypothetical protein
MMKKVVFAVALVVLVAYVAKAEEVIGVVVPDRSSTLLRGLAAKGLAGD